MASTVNHGRGFVVGDYRSNGKELGKGMSGTVYEGVHKETGERVAIKVININKLERINPRAREYLNKEIAIMNMAKHENVLALLAHYISMNEEFVYLVLEICNAGDLSTFLRNREDKRVGEELTQDLIRQFAAGLRCLRYLSVVHRDLKPQNLMLSVDRGRLKLLIADFGLARQINAGSLAQSVVGSPRYMAPEILTGYAMTSRASYTVAADLWSVGVIMFEMLMGKPPFAEARDPRSLLGRINQSEDLVIPLERELSPECCDLLRRLLRRDPAQRITWSAFFSHPWVALEPLDNPPPVDIDTADGELESLKGNESGRAEATPVQVFPHEPKPPSPSPLDAAYRSSPDLPAEVPSKSVSLLTESIRAPSVNPFLNSTSVSDSPAPLQRPSSRGSEDSFERDMVLVRTGTPTKGKRTVCNEESLLRLERLAAGASVIAGIGHEHVRAGQTARGLCSYRLGVSSCKALLEDIEDCLSTPVPEPLRKRLCSLREKLEDYFLFYFNAIRTTGCWSSLKIDPSYQDAFMKAMEHGEIGSTDEYVHNYEKAFVRYRMALGILEVLRTCAEVVRDEQQIDKYIGYLTERLKVVNSLCGSF